MNIKSLESQSRNSLGQIASFFDAFFRLSYSLASGGPWRSSRSMAMPMPDNIELQ